MIKKKILVLPSKNKHSIEECEKKTSNHACFDEHASSTCTWSWCDVSALSMLIYASHFCMALIFRFKSNKRGRSPHYFICAEIINNSKCHIPRIAVACHRRDDSSFSSECCTRTWCYKYLVFDIDYRYSNDRCFLFCWSDYVQSCGNKCGYRQRNKSVGSKNSNGELEKCRNLFFFPIFISRLVFKWMSGW